MSEESIETLADQLAGEIAATGSPLFRAAKEKFIKRITGFLQGESQREEDRLRQSIESGDTIEDGFGLVCSAWCPDCKQKSMEIVRPGKVQCSNCG